MKRVITIQDISCVGKCSLTAAIPVLSCLGIEASVLPTALLSTHTAFDSFYSEDLSHAIPEISDGFKANGISFDAIYTGYIGSHKQVENIISFIDSFRGDASFVVVDPAMADDGKIYAGLPEGYVGSMKALIKRATVIIPNLTEAFLLLDRPYVSPEDLTVSDIDEMLRSLSALCPESVIITGVHSGPDKMGAACYDISTGDISYTFDKMHKGTFLGTGDIFASVVTGSLADGQSLSKSMENAVRFVSRCITETEKDPEKRWYGVSFEKCLSELPGYIS